jgi:phytoene dehydrogenase-like protein
VRPRFQPTTSTCDPCSRFFRLHFDDGETFDYNGDHEHMEREVARLSPDDVEGYRRFLAAQRLAYELGYEKMGAMSFRPDHRRCSRCCRMLRMQGLRKPALPGGIAREGSAAADDAQLSPAADRR